MNLYNNFNFHTTEKLQITEKRIMGLLIVMGPGAAHRLHPPLVGPAILRAENQVIERYSISTIGCVRKCE